MSLLPNQDTANEGPLNGIRVVDMATMLAGPYGATLLGDLGADVIKLESFVGDDSRHLGPEKDGQRSPFLSINRNKRAIALDLTKESSAEPLARLLRTTDVFITNVREPALSKLGLAYEQVKEIRNDIIWVGVTAFGPDGPYAGRPGIDFLAQGYAGLLGLNGEPDGPPVRVTVPMVDVLTSVMVSTGVLAALRVRDQTGKGQQIDVSLLDVLTHAMCSNLVAYTMAGEVTPKTGNRSQYFSPSGVYECGDGKSIVITCPSNKFFRHLSAAMDADWPNDDRFRTIQARLENQEELDEAVSAQCKKFERDDLLLKLIDADVLTAPINEIPDVVSDPQVRHNDMLETVDHAVLGQVEVTGVPLKMRGTPGAVRLAPPVHGGDTSPLLQELGYSAEDVADMIADGIVATFDQLDPRKR